MKLALTDEERRFLMALLRASAAFSASRFERREQVKAELLIRKLENA